MISDTAITGIVTAAGIAFAAVCTAAPLIIAALRKNADKLDASVSLTQEVKEKADHIVALSNGNLAEVKKELATANGQIQGLQTLVKTLIERNGRVDHDKETKTP